MSVEVSDDTPVENIGQLVAFMEKGCKPKENWRISRVKRGAVAARFR